MNEHINVLVSHDFHAPADRVYAAWLEADQVRQWLQAALREFGLPGDLRRIETDPRVGGAFYFSDMRDGQEARHWGTYLELDRPRKIVFTWITEEADEADPSHVTLTLTPVKGGCSARLEHEMDPIWADYTSRVERGWSQMLRSVDELLTSQKVP